MKFLISALVISICALSTAAHAEDANCKRVKNPKHRYACNCAVQVGGYTTVDTNGVKWTYPKGLIGEYGKCIANGPK